MDHVSVTLEWMLEGGVSYDVTADQVIEFKFTQRTTINLTVLYNTTATVNITAIPCGQNNETVITSIDFSYGDHQ